MVKFTYAGENSERLDKIALEALSTKKDFKSLTRSQLKNWIENGQFSINGKVVLRPGAPVQPGSEISVQIIKEIEDSVTPSSRKLEIVYEDEDLMVINKPAGLAMHPGAGRKADTLANAVAGHIKMKDFPKGVRPGIVHRLDMDTTGLVVVAKNVAAHAKLSAQFAKKSTGRTYLALVYSTPRARREIMLKDSGIIDKPLGRDPKKRKNFMVVKTGKNALTSWEMVERLSYAALVKLKLETGRTHQIRVHMNHIGSPVIGDRMYGDFSGLPSDLKATATRFGRQALHAQSLEFDHPSTGKRMKFEVDPPKDFESLVDNFRAWE